VETALDALMRLVAGGHDPRPRHHQLRPALGVVEGNGELTGDELHSAEPFGGERAADETVLQQQQRVQP
jgi:hypothetical protein